MGHTINCRPKRSEYSREIDRTSEKMLFTFMPLIIRFSRSESNRALQHLDKISFNVSSWLEVARKKKFRHIDRPVCRMHSMKWPWKPFSRSKADESERSTSMKTHVAPISRDLKRGQGGVHSRRAAERTSLVVSGYVSQR